MQKPNIIFLDIDGVLCTLRAHIAFDMGHNGNHNIDVFDPVAVRFLNRLGREYGFNIVVSSTWRDRFDRDAINTIFRTNGMTVPLFHHAGEDKAWQTAPRTTIVPRSKEVQDWLDKYGEHINNFIIIDDVDYFSTTPELANHTFITHTENGITTQNMEDVLEFCEGL